MRNYSKVDRFLFGYKTKLNFPLMLDIDTYLVIKSEQIIGDFDCFIS